MDQGTLLNIGLVLLFVLVGGVFAGHRDRAGVAARESGQPPRARRARRGARVAAVARDPNRFLAAVQIGVTVAGLLLGRLRCLDAGAGLRPGSAAPGPCASRSPSRWRWSLLTLVIAYLSLVLGELVPKRLALQRAAHGGA